MAIGRRVLGPTHPFVLKAISYHADNLIKMGNLNAAEPLCREALEGRLRVLGNDHPQTVISKNMLSSFFSVAKPTLEW